MTIRITLITTALLAVGLISGAAHAALQGRDLNGSVGSFEAYYDTDLNITWLANANVNGLMTWRTAYFWALNLSFTDGVNVYDNWRLPATLQPDASCSYQLVNSLQYNCTGSEMGHLFHNELGGSAMQSILTSADPDLAKFTNLQANNYWSEEFAQFLGWYFDTSTGYQSFTDKSTRAYYALAVSPGDVGVVPEADTWAMLLVGLGLVGAVTRRRRG